MPNGVVQYDPVQMHPAMSTEGLRAYTDNQDRPQSKSGQEFLEDEGVEQAGIPGGVQPRTQSAEDQY
jgi:hypothetical protein